MKLEIGKELTKAEDQIMQILWSIEMGFVKDIVDKLPDPKPAYSTVSTMVRILEKKGFVWHNTFGNTHQYYPLVSRDVYKKAYMGNFIKNYFSNSFKQMVSFFSKENNLSLEELDEIKKLMEIEIDNQKKNK
jgi:BlaI family transcriptional regulator, penicillinase repressor